LEIVKVELGWGDVRMVGAVRGGVVACGLELLGVKALT